MNEDKKYPEGHFKGIWMLIGFLLFAGIGIPLSIPTNVKFNLLIISDL